MYYKINCAAALNTIRVILTHMRACGFLKMLFIFFKLSFHKGRLEHHYSSLTRLDFVLRLGGQPVVIRGHSVATGIDVHRRLIPTGHALAALPASIESSLSHFYSVLSQYVHPPVDLCRIYQTLRPSDGRLDYNAVSGRRRSRVSRLWSVWPKTKSVWYELVRCANIIKILNAIHLWKRRGGGGWSSWKLLEIVNHS